MPTQTKATIHEVIREIFGEVCNSATPFSTVALWCLRLKESRAWAVDDIDQVADTVVRMVALHRRAFGQPPPRLPVGYEQREQDAIEAIDTVLQQREASSGDQTASDFAMSGGRWWGEPAVACANSR